MTELLLTRRLCRDSAVAYVATHHSVPLEGLEPPTVCLGRNCSSIELQRLARQV